MWKIVVAFIVFAAIAVFILTKSGGDVDLGGEKHSAEAPPPEATPASAAPASTPTMQAAPASGPSSASAPAGG